MTYIIPHAECKTYHPRNNSNGNLFALDKQGEAMAAGDSKAYLRVPVEALMRQRYGEENLNRLAPQGATSYCTKNTALFTNFIPNAVAQAFRMRYDSVMPTKTRHGQQGIDQQPTRTLKIHTPQINL